MFWAHLENRSHVNKALTVLYSQMEEATERQHMSKYKPGKALPSRKGENQVCFSFPRKNNPGNRGGLSWLQKRIPFLINLWMRKANNVKCWKFAMNRWTKNAHISFSSIIGLPFFPLLFTLNSLSLPLSLSFSLSLPRPLPSSLSPSLSSLLFSKCHNMYNIVSFISSSSITGKLQLQLSCNCLCIKND